GRLPMPLPPSSPTRRSSDLASLQNAAADYRTRPRKPSLSRQMSTPPAENQLSRFISATTRSYLCLRPLSVPAKYHRRGLKGVQRSEEHTSELQSLAYIVCRL